MLFCLDQTQKHRKVGEGKAMKKIVKTDEKGTILLTTSVAPFLEPPGVRSAQKVGYVGIRPPFSGGLATGAGPYPLYLDFLGLLYLDDA